MKREQVVIHSEFIKLDSLLKFCGAAGTGGHAKDMITNGDVLVNGEACLQRGRKIYPGMTVQIAGQELLYEVVTVED